MDYYTTVQGDTWDVIAKKVYKDEKQLLQLLRANPAWVDTVFFPSGVTLEVPVMTRDDIPSELPPWKRGGALA